MPVISLVSGYGDSGGIEWDPRGPRGRSETACGVLGRMTFPEDLGTIASIWAHPDDETFLAGGVMAAAAAGGQRVICVSATAGELGTSDPQTWPPERLGRVRRWEASAAMAILGVADHRWLGYADGSLADLQPDDPVDRLADILT